MASSPRFFFRKAPSDFHLFHSYHCPPNSARACLLFAPFAEELNKSRRMLGQLQYKLASANIASLLIDTSGTGDSEGDFQQGTVENWLQEFEDAANWLQAKHAEPLSLLGLRTGALFAAHTASKQKLLHKLVLWQPVQNGAQFINQFLRLRIGADIVSGNSEKVTTQMIREQIVTAGTEEIAGYSLSAELLIGIEALKLQALLSSVSCDIEWLEMVSTIDRPLSPASRKLVSELETEGKSINAQTIVGDNFWATQEIVDVPELIDQTVNLLRPL